MRLTVCAPLILQAATLMLATSAVAQQTRDYIFGDGFEPGPLLWYRFDGNATNTGSASGYALTLNDATYATGVFGQAIQFGSAGYAQVPGMRGVLGVLPQVTVGFWYYEFASADRAYWDVDNRSTAPYGGVQLGELSSQSSECVSTTTTSYLGGACFLFFHPSINNWHHWIISYAGTGTGPGQGGPISFYIDDVLQLTLNNDSLNNPVFNSGISDTLTIGQNIALMDDLRVYDRVFSRAEQCTRIIDGVWTGSNCVLP